MSGLPWSDFPKEARVELRPCWDHQADELQGDSIPTATLEKGIEQEEIEHRRRQPPQQQQPPPPQQQQQQEEEEEEEGQYAQDVSDEPPTVDVVVPEGCVAGDVITLQLPDDDGQIDVEVPDGLVAGDVFEARLVDDG
eukprot:COSAG02_NODE_11146_length_1780_cov_3.459026_2_plen_138_part_00